MLHGKTLVKNTGSGQNPFETRIHDIVRRSLEIKRGDRLEWTIMEFEGKKFAVFRKVE